MSIHVGVYTVYLLISVALCVWVARTLHKNGRVFLVDVFKEKEDLADSINHLLVVGFYLINFGYISLMLKISDPIRRVEEGVESLSLKIGTVLMILGVMHFLNLYIFSRIRGMPELRTK